MSGLCGWLGPEPDGGELRSVLGEMAAGLGHCTEAVTRTVHGQTSALAAASLSGEPEIRQEAGVFVALEGYPRWSETRLAQLAEREGAARALLQGYRQMGPDLLEVIQGDFAFACIDRDRNEALLAVDRMGIRPLAYSLAHGNLVFGSTADSVIAHPAVAADIEPQAIFDYLYFNMIPSPRTIYAGVHKLEPAQYLHYRNGQLRTGRYWMPTFQEENQRGMNDLAGDLREILGRTIRRSDPDCTTGAFLSGGLDSSTVSGMLSRVCNKPARTFSIGFDASGYDEIEYARIAARHFHAAAYEYYVTPRDVADALPLIAGIYDEPFGNSSALPVYYCGRLARQHGVRVMLAGDGGDELFAGNTRYLKQKVFGFYARLPEGLRRRLLEPLVFGFPLGDRIGLIGKARSYMRQANIPLPERLETYNLLHMVPLEEIFDPGFLGAVDPYEPLAALRETYDRPATPSSLNRMLYLDWKFTLADNDLRKVNRMCKASGIEVRYPMLDEELVAFSARVPPALKIKGLRLRHFYKQAISGFLPREIISKSKQGFGLPFGVWLRGSNVLQELVYDNLHTLKGRNYLKASFIDRVIHDHKTDHAGFYGNMLWVLMMLELWFQKHGRQA